MQQQRFKHYLVRFLVLWASLYITATIIGDIWITAVLYFVGMGVHWILSMD